MGYGGWAQFQPTALCVWEWFDPSGVASRFGTGILSVGWHRRLLKVLPLGQTHWAVRLNLWKLHRRLGIRLLVAFEENWPRPGNNQHLAACLFREDRKGKAGAPHAEAIHRLCALALFGIETLKPFPWMSLT